MTTYAYDLAARHLLAVCGGGAGSTAHTVARLHERTPVPLGMQLAHQLTLLSSTAWMSYTDAELAGPVPVGAALAALREPNLRRGARLRREPDWIIERTHEIGRTLVEIGSAGVRRAVTDDVAAEFHSIERALLGDLSGRSAQAVELTRLDASPTQIVAADRLLHDVPMGGERLFTDVEPTAGCVAAAHWLRAAVDVTLRMTGGSDCREVLNPEKAADPFDTLAPRIVIAAIEAGCSPLASVQRLVGPAMQVARGFLPIDEDRGDMVILDPLRPARHLLDRLGTALITSGRVHREHLDPGCSDLERVEAARQVFDGEVREEAERTTERLLSTFPA